MLTERVQWIVVKGKIPTKCVVNFEGIEISVKRVLLNVESLQMFTECVLQIAEQGKRSTKCVEWTAECLSSVFNKISNQCISYSNSYLMSN